MPSWPGPAAAWRRTPWPWRRPRLLPSGTHGGRRSRVVRRHSAAKEIGHGMHLRRPRVVEVLADTEGVLDRSQQRIVVVEGVGGVADTGQWRQHQQADPSTAVGAV